MVEVEPTQPCEQAPNQPPKSFLACPSPPVLWCFGGLCGVSTGNIRVANWLDLVYNEMFKLRFSFSSEHFFFCYFAPPLIPLPILLIKNKN